ncbi:hypothetical protein KC19_1G320100 [Ceratodon purpureus]|uniref:Uncharacterized protein n=1 Tax=Ceratodon purpureus TaxID=3225 RepID=A0A8T0JBX5_CERPU|nr:hypothetical protein KC19_1G320100 [Ceratodon purpureus]
MQDKNAKPGIHTRPYPSILVKSPIDNLMAPIPCFALVQHPSPLSQPCLSFQNVGNSQRRPTLPVRIALPAIVQEQHHCMRGNLVLPQFSHNSSLSVRAPHHSQIKNAAIHP